MILGNVDVLWTVCACVACCTLRPPLKEDANGLVGHGQLLLRQHCRRYRRWCQHVFEERLDMATCQQKIGLGLKRGINGGYPFTPPYFPPIQTQMAIIYLNSEFTTLNQCSMHAPLSPHSKSPHCGLALARALQNIHCPGLKHST